jgi:hypothetical protein
MSPSQGKWTMKKVGRRLKFLASEGQDTASGMAQAVGRAVGGALASLVPDGLQPKKRASTTH